jgi:hypothetical protein
MNKKEIDSMRWSQYDIELPPLDSKLMEECIGIIDNLNSRKVDVVNWEERKAMDEVTKRSGHYINSGELEEVEAAQQLDETAGATNEKEKDLMSGMSDILKELEQLDE